MLESSPNLNCRVRCGQTDGRGSVLNAAL